MSNSSRKSARFWIVLFALPLTALAWQAVAQSAFPVLLDRPAPQGAGPPADLAGGEILDPYHQRLTTGPTDETGVTQAISPSSLTDRCADRDGCTIRFFGSLADRTVGSVTGAALSLELSGRYVFRDFHGVVATPGLFGDTSDAQDVEIWVWSTVLGTATTCYFEDVSGGFQLRAVSLGDTIDCLIRIDD